MLRGSFLGESGKILSHVPCGASTPQVHIPRAAGKWVGDSETGDCRGGLGPGSAGSTREEGRSSAPGPQDGLAPHLPTRGGRPLAAGALWPGVGAPPSGREPEAPPACLFWRSPFLWPSARILSASPGGRQRAVEPGPAAHGLSGTGDCDFPDDHQQGVTRGASHGAPAPSSCPLR